MEAGDREAFVIAWHMQQLVIFSIIENVSSTGPIKFMVFLIFVNHDVQALNCRHFEIEILTDAIMTFFV